MKKHFLLAIAVLTQASALNIPTVFADESVALARSGEWRQTLQEHGRMLGEFQQGELKNKTREAMDNMVAYGISRLRDSGYAADADVLEASWAEQSAVFASGGLAALGLGDHRPVNEWFGEFYRVLGSRIAQPDTMMGILLSDINIFNYAIPVVFHPKGDQVSGETWDRMEYRRHFIPFSGAVTFWGSYLACSLYLRNGNTGVPGQQIGQACQKIGTTFRTGAIRFMAPSLSDFIYRKANGRETSPLRFDVNELSRKYERNARG